MGNVLEFPDNGRDFAAIEAHILKICRKNGVPEAAAREAIEEYRPIHDSLFSKENNQLTFPPEAELTDEQARIIEPILKDFFQSRMGVAAMTIIGLLVRERLDNRGGS